MPDLALGIHSGLARCHDCGKTSRLSAPQGHCPRCGGHLSFRISDSLSKTWALLITAAVLFIPANIYPVMTVISFGAGDPATIMSGVIQLVQADMYPIAILVFVASIIVPLFKLIGIAALLLVIQFRVKVSFKHATIMYRFIHFIGRWSMLDLFMISILVTLVNMGQIASITTGVGATAFSGVVVVTMIAAHVFDQRLIWDIIAQSDDAVNQEAKLAG